MFGFIKRLSREFRDSYTLKVLYVTYVRSKLEYANCVWQPFNVTHIKRIERIQEKFIKHAPKQFRWNVNASTQTDLDKFLTIFEEKFKIFLN
jgi:hypothetical protein